VLLRVPEPNKTESFNRMSFLILIVIFTYAVLFYAVIEEVTRSIKPRLLLIGFFVPPLLWYKVFSFLVFSVFRLNRLLGYFLVVLVFLLWISVIAGFSGLAVENFMWAVAGYIYIWSCPLVLITGYVINQRRGQKAK
jgi:hypothetical protein